MEVQTSWNGSFHFSLWPSALSLANIKRKKNNNYNIIPFWRRVGSHISIISYVVFWCQIRERHVYIRYSKKVNCSNARLLKFLFKTLSLALFGLNVFEIFKNTKLCANETFLSPLDNNIYWIWCRWKLHSSSSTDK